jgi:gamma-glutamylcyclotransferase (GGCT)/AIG2-like uncharacterized protein YtfP
MLQSGGVQWPEQTESRPLLKKIKSRQAVMHLFAYGTLMFPEIWRRLIGREVATVTATLAGYAVYRVSNGSYPVMVSADSGAEVHGVIYFNVDQPAIAILDEYESSMYDRVAVTAMAGDGRSVECQAYVLPEARRAYASNEPWDADRYARESLAGDLRSLEEG